VKTDLRELEEQALVLMNRGEKAKAAELFKAIIRERPDWEHGEAFYDLAGCQEDLGELDKASESYRRALEYEPRNPYFLGGYASFLYLHGDPKSAFEQHLSLWEIERNNEDSSAKIMNALRELSKRLGLSDQELQDRLKEISAKES
jgi:Flp pilus assembly protein TadD